MSREKRNPACFTEVLALGLLSVGIGEDCRLSAAAVQVPVPPVQIEEALALAVNDPVVCRKLAASVTHCAEEGGHEIYQALPALLMLNGSEQLFILLDEAIVPDAALQLFNRCS